MGDQHFTFLGYREYDLVRAGDADELCPVAGSALGIVRNAPERTSASFASLPPEVRARAHDRTLLILTKANRRATVHRPTYLDYIGVRKFDATTGEVVGEHRFLGLFTSSAYNSTPLDVPVLRQKVAAVIDRAGFLPASHDHKDLLAILETYPRDDLFQADVDTLFENVMGILQLQERRRVRMFVHREIYGRFVSCLVYLPRDRYTTPVRERIAKILTEAFGARSHEWTTRLSESVLARLQFVLHVDPRRPANIDLAALEARVAKATRAWTDDLRDALVTARGEEEGLSLLRSFAGAFPAAYQDDFPAREVLADLAPLQELDDTGGLAARLYNGIGLEAELKLYGAGTQPSLSEVLPSLTNMGVIVLDERPYDIAGLAPGPRWIKHFRLRTPDARHDDRIGPKPVRGRVPRGPRRRDRRRRLQSPRPRGRPVVARSESAARVQPVPASGRNALQPGVHRGRTRRASRSRPRARRAVRRAARSVDRGTGATPIASSTSCAPASTRSPASTRTASCAACSTSCSRRCARTGSRPGRRRTAADASCSSSTRTRVPDCPAPAADVRDLRVLAARRGRAPARRARSRAAASAGRTAAKTSAPRSSA